MQVLGIGPVQRTSDSSNEFSEEFPEVTTYQVRGSIWTYTSLPRTTCSTIALTSMIAGGCWEELVIHVYPALYNVMTAEEIKGVFLRSAIYCSFPAASTSFKIGMAVPAENPAIDENRTPPFIGSGCWSCDR